MPSHEGIGVLRLLASVLVITTLLAAPLAAGARPRTWTQAQLAAVIVARFGPVGQAAKALCVARRESSGPAGVLRPNAVNGRQVGLFEIDEPTWDPALNPRALPIVGRVNFAQIFDPVVNTLVAFRIWQHSGWLPAWTADESACGL